jgi:hypothetical protein
MGFETEKYAAADVAVNDNLAKGKDWQKDDRRRRIKKVGLAGSTNPCDCILDIFYGSKLIAKIVNTTGGAAKVPEKDDFHYISSQLYCAAQEQINVIVRDAADTEIVCLCLDIQEF